jgi:hypothetical protein
VNWQSSILGKYVREMIGTQVHHGGEGGKGWLSCRVIFNALADPPNCVTRSSASTKRGDSAGIEANQPREGVHEEGLAHQPGLAALNGQMSLLKAGGRRWVVNDRITKVRVRTPIIIKKFAKKCRRRIQRPIDVSARITRFSSVRFFWIYKKYAARPCAMPFSQIDVGLNSGLDKPDHCTFVGMPSIPMPHKMRVQRFHAGKIRPQMND